MQHHQIGFKRTSCRRWPRLLHSIHFCRHGLSRDNRWMVIMVGHSDKLIGTLRVMRIAMNKIAPSLQPELIAEWKLGWRIKIKGWRSHRLARIIISSCGLILNMEIIVICLKTFLEIEWMKLIKPCKLVEWSIKSSFGFIPAQVPYHLNNPTQSIPAGAW